jgi:hypothetical protein
MADDKDNSEPCKPACGGTMYPWNARLVYRDAEDKVVLRCTRCGETKPMPRRHPEGSGIHMADRNDDSVNYGLKEPFDIDNGELDGIAAKDAFALGVEWQMVSQQLDGAEPFARPIHDENVSRIKRMCIRRGWQFKVADNGADWKSMEFEPAKA